MDDNKSPEGWQSHGSETKSEHHRPPHTRYCHASSTRRPAPAQLSTTKITKFIHLGKVNYGTRRRGGKSGNLSKITFFWGGHFLNEKAGMTSQLKAPVCWSSEVEDQLNTPRLLLYWATKTQKALSRASVCPGLSVQGYSENMAAQHVKEHPLPLKM